jgi:hypothetical protein
MKSLRITLSLILISLATTLFAESDAPASFARLKTLAGTWEGPITTTPAEPAIEGKTMRVTLRVTSMGNALMHEMTTPARPDDPITLFYLDDDRVLLTHYCDAGNRPRMTGKMSGDGKTMEFAFLDLAGGTKYGHMHGAKFAFIDADHHVEEWTYMTPGDKPVLARVDLTRVK